VLAHGRHRRAPVGAGFQCHPSGAEEITRVGQTHAAEAAGRRTHREDVDLAVVVPLQRECQRPLGELLHRAGGEELGHGSRHVEHQRDPGRLVSQ
jgi:hypothetical protein